MQLQRNKNLFPIKRKRITVQITLAEFGLDLDVYLINPKNESKVYKLRELLPIAFTPRDLLKHRAAHDVID
ncbi:unnamed protein product [Adineta steineri]|uniref:Uncharacterized protein n=1 Tax=Adineta steineri TaxID=433720 RepID=A0A815J0M7_9BILA|nr:unnamed protein product [Adineta steineri]